MNHHSTRDLRLVLAFTILAVSSASAENFGSTRRFCRSLDEFVRHVKSLHQDIVCLDAKVADGYYVGVFHPVGSKSLIFADSPVEWAWRFTFNRPQDSVILSTGAESRLARAADTADNKPFWKALNGQYAEASTNSASLIDWIEGGLFEAPEPGTRLLIGWNKRQPDWAVLFPLGQIQPAPMPAPWLSWASVLTLLSIIAVSGLAGWWLKGKWPLKRLPQPESA